MELKHQVNTLEQGRRFSELGVTAESYFVWAKLHDNLGIIVMPKDFAKNCSDAIYPAFSGTELGVMLGKYNCQSIGDVLEAKIRADKLIHLLEQKIIKPEDLKL